MFEDAPSGGAASGGGATGRRRTALFWILVVVGGLLFATFAARVGQGVFERLRPPPDVEIPPTLVEAIAVTAQPFERTVPIAGSLTPIQSVDVFPRLGGKVVSLYVGLGDEVTLGQPLAAVDSTEYRLQARQAEVGQRMAEEAVEQAERSFGRLDRVREQSGSMGLSEQAFERAEIEVAGARTQAEQATLQRALAERMVSNGTMFAPITGVVSKVQASLGAMVGDEYPAFHIDDLSSFMVRCEVGDLDLPAVNAGQPVRLWTDAIPGLTLVGEVVAVAPSLDAWTRRAPVEIEVPNPDGGVTGNLFARGEIVVDVDPEALVLPVNVVRRSVDGAWVQLAVEGAVREAAVKVIGESRDHLAVSGLSPGQLVIVPGAEHLAEGEPVTVVQSSEPVADVAQ